MHLVVQMQSCLARWFKKSCVLQSLTSKIRGKIRLLQKLLVFSRSQIFRIHNPCKILNKIEIDSEKNRSTFNVAFSPTLNLTNQYAMRISKLTLKLSMSNWRGLRAMQCTRQYNLSVHLSSAAVLSFPEPWVTWQAALAWSRGGPRSHVGHGVLSSTSASAGQQAATLKLHTREPRLLRSGKIGPYLKLGWSINKLLCGVWCFLFCLLYIFALRLQRLLRIRKQLIINDELIAGRKLCLGNPSKKKKL